MIARVARFNFPSLRHVEEAKRNGRGRVGPSLARQPGFVAIYFGWINELEGFSITVFENRDSADAAGATMNAQPLLPGQVPELLPTPVSVRFYDVAHAVVHDRLPVSGRLGYLTLAPGQTEASADRWATESFGPTLKSVAGLCQAYLLADPDSPERAALTFWTGPDPMESGGAAIGSWQTRETAQGRAPAYLGTEEFVLTLGEGVDAPIVVAAVPNTMPQPV
jgi:hypothetical protein